ncbi:MAG: DJ-1/PfpI family protein [Acidimicrobiales bacterium]
MEIVILAFDQLTALDAVGPYDVLARLPGARVRLAGVERGVVRTEQGGLGLAVDVTLDEVGEPEVVVIPGGAGTRRLIHDTPVLDWVRRVDETASWTASVCTGSLVLAAAGLLDGLEATTHWLWTDLLAQLGARPVDRRVVEVEVAPEPNTTPGRSTHPRRRITSAGVSAGIDMALTLAAHVAGEDVARAIQLAIEYDPHPPFDSGSPLTAPPRIVELVRQRAGAAEAAPAPSVRPTPASPT